MITTTPAPCSATGVHGSGRDPAWGFPLDLERELFDRPELERLYTLDETIDVSDDEHPGRRFDLLVFARRDLVP